ncbi:MAG: UDP-3-O-acyl-N-acetylglucosamine deacetylase [Alphaproteobacteria bacterium]
MTARYDGASAVQQGTLRASVGCSGTGLHSGQQIAMSFHPAAPNTGIVFRRTDARGAIIPANWRHVVDTRLCSVIANADGVRVGTIEHAMAALAGTGIDNVRIDIDGPEVPAMDGSSAPFVAMIEQAGITRQGIARRAIEVLKTVRAADGAAHAELAPADMFTVSCAIDFDTPAINRQARTVTLMNGAFKSELCRARTFGFEHEVEQLRKMGLARGGSLENAIVIGQDRVLNADGLRYDDEFVRHKILDCVGDLYLAGGPILGHFSGHRSGHALNHQVLQNLFADATAWRFTTLRKPAVRAARRPELRLATAVH